MRQTIRVTTLHANGEETDVMHIVADSDESDDPLAFSWGRMQGQKGEPMEEASEDDDLAPEYIRGYNLGRKEWEAKNDTSVSD